ncbi:MAG: N-acetyltransferase family protein [Rhodoglobus sp.]
MTVQLRPAHDRDLDAILAIHNEAIRNSPAIWYDEPVERSDREAWLAEHEAMGHPVIVAEVDGVVAGYASYGPWRPRSGYRYTVENSVYLDTEHRGQGLGRALLVDLIARARAAGLHMMVANIEASNVASIRLHESLGFERSGFIREVGRKYDRWLDLAILQLRLD